MPGCLDSIIRIAYSHESGISELSGIIELSDLSELSELSKVQWQTGMVQNCLNLFKDP